MHINETHSLAPQQVSILENNIHHNAKVKILKYADVCNTLQWVREISRTNLTTFATPLRC